MNIACVVLIDVAPKAIAKVLYPGAGGKVLGRTPIGGRSKSANCSFI